MVVIWLVVVITNVGLGNLVRNTEVRTSIGRVMVAAQGFELQVSPVTVRSHAQWLKIRPEIGNAACLDIFCPVSRNSDVPTQ